MPTPAPIMDRQSGSQPGPSAARNNSSNNGFLGFGRKLGQAASAMGEAITRTAASAGELLTDRELRRKGAAFIMSEAHKGFSEFQKGIQESAENLGKGIKQGASRINPARNKQVQSVLGNIEKQIQEYQRARHLRDLQDDLDSVRRQPVDIQIGPQVYEDMPQEMRSRLWYVLLEQPELAEPLRPISGGKVAPPLHGPRPTSAAATASSTSSTSAAGAATAGPSPLAPRPPSVPIPPPPPPAKAAGRAQATSATAATAAPASPAVNLPPAPSAEASGGDDDTAAPSPASTEPLRRRMDTSEDVWGDSISPAASTDLENALQQQQQQQQQQEKVASRPEIDALMARLTSGRTASTAPATAATAGGARTSAPATSASRRTPTAPAAAAGGSSGPPPRRTSDSDRSAADSYNTAATNQEARTSHTNQAVRRLSQSQPQLLEQSDGSWEVVSREGVPVFGRGGELETVETVRGIVQSLQHPDAAQNQARHAKQALFEAMLEVPWQADTGISSAYPPNCHFATLVQMTEGQEHVDEIITRDINRTFPEHPFFGFEQGQQSLFRVLKAYAVHDKEVGYCQGMAFAAGILLMYLPEELAFRLFCRLMDPDGPNLRRLYLPGLEALKSELNRFEYVMSQQLPALYAHLTEYGVPSVLYASQWLMTAFACPFPAPFAARLIDVMLQDDNDHVMMRAGVAVMEECAPALLELDDFEAIITLLKVQPLQWPIHQARRVLNRSINSPITEQQLKQAAEHVAAEAAERSVLRSTSSRRVTEPSTTATAAEQPAIQPETETESVATAPAAAAVGPVAPAVGDGAAAAAADGEEAVAPAAQGQAELDEAYMDLVMQLNSLMLPGAANFS